MEFLCNLLFVGWVRKKYNMPHLIPPCVEFVRARAWFHVALLYSTSDLWKESTTSSGVVPPCVITLHLWMCSTCLYFGIPLDVWHLHLLRCKLLHFCRCGERSISDDNSLPQHQQSLTVELIQAAGRHKYWLGSCLILVAPVLIVDTVFIHVWFIIGGVVFRTLLSYSFRSFPLQPSEASNNCVPLLSLRFEVGGGRWLKLFIYFLITTLLMRRC